MENGKENGMDLLNPENQLALDMLVKGGSLQQAHQQASLLKARYGAIKEELQTLHKQSASARHALQRLSSTMKDQFDPKHGSFDPSRGNIRDLSTFKFITKVTSDIITRIDNSLLRLTMMNFYLDNLMPVLNGKVNPDTVNLTNAEESAIQVMDNIRAEVEEAIYGFEKLVANIYLLTRAEYKRMKHKFIGAALDDSEKDDLEEYMFQQMFGRKPAQSEFKPGPALSLVDDNCFLTQILMDLAEAMPKESERTIPVLRGGIATGKTKTTKVLNEDEVEEACNLLISVAQPSYVKFAEHPDQLLAAIILGLKEYYRIYNPVSTTLLRIMSRAGITVTAQKPPSEYQMVNPISIDKPYQRINFLRIRPTADDTAPRNKAERDFAIARNKLLLHLKESLITISRMDGDADETEKYIQLRVREAVKLKEETNEVIKSEHDRQMKRDIKDDNEFYISKGGNLGSIEVEREPAPKITYEDVIGASFIKAKAHIEEVVNIASHPHIMRLSAPRGDVKSNIMLIGPYGCGKTELSRAVGADRRIIGLSISTADLLTAYMHESVKNIKRMYDAARDLRRKSRNTKPVGILLDEFDGMFSYGEGVHAAYDGRRMETTLQEMMDGVVGYEGVFIVALTNNPKVVPQAILRRFKFVDVVGQLNREERAQLFRKFVARLPIDPSVNDDSYLRWADMLVDAPGDVIGKVADEIHFKYMDKYITTHNVGSSKVELKLARRLRDREIKPKDRELLRGILLEHGGAVTETEITASVEGTLRQPQVQMQVNTAKKVYKDAEEILQGLSVVGDRGLGFTGPVRKKAGLWE